MSTLPSTVTVRVPGSTSNCGSGFDTLGLALQVHNHVELTRADGTAACPATAADGRGTNVLIVFNTPSKGSTRRGWRTPRGP